MIRSGVDLLVQTVSNCPLLAPRSAGKNVVRPKRTVRVSVYVLFSEARAIDSGTSERRFPRIPDQQESLGNEALPQQR